MNLAEMVASVLYNCDDPENAGRLLLPLLLAGSIDCDKVRRDGFDPDLVNILKRTLPCDPDGITSACNLGVAWLQGRRSVPEKDKDSWELVITIPPSARLPLGARRGTAETLAALITGAHSQVRITAPFIDDKGISYLAGPIAAATSRNVFVDLIVPAASPVINILVEKVSSEGHLENISILINSEPLPWPHLKVVVVDSNVAYIGSANITWPGLGGKNLEVGVLVRGKNVSIIDRVLDLIPVDRHKL